MHLGAGTVLSMQDDLAAAATELAAAATAFAETGNEPMQALVALELARVADRRGDLVAARAAAHHARDLARRSGTVVTEIEALVQLADVAGSDDADRLLREAEELLGRTPVASARAAVAARRAWSAIRAGAADAAARQLADALSARSAVEELAAAGLPMRPRRDLELVNEALVRLALDRGATSDALERLDARLTALFRTAAPADVAARAGELQAVYDGLLDAARRGDPARVAALEQRARAIERTVLGDLAEQSMFDRPGRAEPARRLHHAVAPCSVVYAEIGGELVAMVTVDGSTRAVRGLGGPSEIRALVDRLAVHIDRGRPGDHVLAHHRQQLVDSTTRWLGRLHDLLWAPLGLPTSGRVVVVPSGSLWRVPFAALWTGTAHLVDDVVITVAPSLSVEALAHRRTPEPGAGAHTVGVSDTDIADAVDEAMAVSFAIPACRSLVGDGAVWSAVDRNPLAFLHLACHGLFRPDNGMYSTFRFADRWVSATELGELQLKGAIVALSSCQSGRATIAGGVEVQGSLRALLAAGASNVVSTLWLAPDGSTSELITCWARALAAGATSSDALRTAQIATKQRWPHPYHWAGFASTAPTCRWHRGSARGPMPEQIPVIEINEGQCILLCPPGSTT